MFTHFSDLQGGKEKSKGTQDNQCNGYANVSSGKSAAAALIGSCHDDSCRLGGPGQFGIFQLLWLYLNVIRILVILVAWHHVLLVDDVDRQSFVVSFVVKSD
jgi:hypothetical protein